jgi:hypothetical protein
MMKLNAVEFERRSGETFTASYFSTLGIIQNFTLGGLALRLLEFFFAQPCALLENCPAIHTPYDGMLVFGQAIGTFLAVVLITGEYTWWTLIVRRSPKYRDVLIPYSLGIAEFVAAMQVNNLDGRWFTLMALLGSVGVIARLYAQYDSRDARLFHECAWLQPLLIRNLNIGTVCIILMVIVFSVARFIWGKVIVGDPVWIYSLACFYVLAFLTIQTSSNFLNRVREQFERELDEQQRLE